MDGAISVSRLTGAVLALGSIVCGFNTTPSITTQTIAQSDLAAPESETQRAQSPALPENENPPATEQVISKDQASQEKFAPTSPYLGATAGDCSAILQNISAGGDIYLNIKCDMPSEQRIIEAIADGNWDWECPIAVPEKGWNSHADGANGRFSITPRKGHYFSQFGFRFDMQITGEGPLDSIYFNQLAWETVDAKIPNIDKPLYDQLADVIEEYPPSQIAFDTRARNLLYEAASVANGGSEDQFDAAPDETRVGEFDLNVEVQYEDGSFLESESVQIYKSAGSYTSSLGLREFVDPYPEWTDNDESRQTLRELSCVANEGIGLAAFSTLCSLMFEQQAAEALDCYHTDPE
jgi:hypothetical protein